MSGSDPRDALTVDLAALRRRGIDRHRIDLELPPAWLAEALSQTDATAEGPGRLTLEVLLQPRAVVYVHGELQVGFSVPCGRCLEPAAVAEVTKLTATFLPASDAPTPAAGADPDDDEDGLALAGGDLDAWTYAGTRLALTELVAEQVKLVYPMRALCTHGDACRGLCSNCGAALNGHEGLACPSCGRSVPQTPVADLPSPEGAQAADAGADEPSGRGPLADALRKLMS